MDASAGRAARARAAGLRDGRALVVAALPSARSLAAGVALLLAGAALYAAARETSMFALRSVTVEGASPRVAREVRAALAPLAGRSLVHVDATDVLSRVEALPEVRSAGYDRAFPHTLVVTVLQERPVAVLRTGSKAWLVSARGRVLRRIARGTRPRLARVWAPATTGVRRGERVENGAVAQAVAVAALAREHLSARVLTARSQDEQLTLGLAGGRELRLGDDLDLELKLAVANAVLRELPDVRAGGPTYLDVSVPERAVAGRTLKSELEADG